MGIIILRPFRPEIHFTVGFKLLNTIPSILRDGAGMPLEQILRGVQGKVHPALGIISFHGPFLVFWAMLLGWLPSKTVVWVLSEILS